MAKHLKLTIKNTQIAEAVNLGSLKDKLAKKKGEAVAEESEKPVSPAKRTPKAKAAKEVPVTEETSSKVAKEEPTRVRARSKSVFAEGQQPAVKEPIAEAEETAPALAEEIQPKEETRAKPRSSEELRRQLFGDDVDQKTPSTPTFAPLESLESPVETEPKAVEPTVTPKKEVEAETKQPFLTETPVEAPKEEVKPKSLTPATKTFKEPPPIPARAPYVKLGPTGRHVKDLLPPPRPRPQPTQERRSPPPAAAGPVDEASAAKAKFKGRGPESSDDSLKRGTKAPTKEFRDVKPAKRTPDGQRAFDGRDRQGLRDTEEDQRWRKKRALKQRQEEQVVVRPTSLKVRTPISIKDLAVEMKLKASQLIAKLFLQGIVVTLNDLLEDETTIQLLGHEFGCEISIDTTEERRIRITDKTIREEISQSPEENLVIRPPVVTFMGHVDHGKTSLIDSIRKSNRVSGEAGAITQHIGAFRCHTAVGDIAILDTPGHEAFSAMRARGADVTDIVVLVVAGDEGMKPQTIEALEQARTANVTIVVAINKSDKPNFNAENVYRQLAEQNLLPEAWGGQTLTVNCSAVTGEGVKELLEMLALQAEVMELKADPKARARGTLLESELHKGMGAVATIFVQNGTLHIGDSLVFDQHWGRVKTMRDEFGNNLTEAPPSTPVAVTGLSGVPEAGQEFIVVPNEREAREIAEVRQQGIRQSQMQQRKKFTAESLASSQSAVTKKVLNVILRADVQGSLEALRVALQKIESTKAEINIVFSGVGEVSESDIQRAVTSKAVIIGFHTQVESHAESLVKQLNVQIRLHDVIYHAIDDVKLLMTGLLDKIAQETDRGKAEVKAVFKSSHVGLIAGCIVTEGTIQRNHHLRVIRDGQVIGKAQISSLRRVKDDVREVAKGLECGISLSKFSDIQEGDIFEAYEITYLTQEL